MQQAMRPVVGPPQYAPAPPRGDGPTLTRFGVRKFVLIYNKFRRGTAVNVTTNIFN